jgi:hypothetical protein
MRVKLREDSNMERAKKLTLKERYTMGIGFTTKEKAVVPKTTLLVQNMKVTGKKICSMVKEYSHTLTIVPLLENLQKVK